MDGVLNLIGTTLGISPLKAIHTSVN